MIGLYGKIPAQADFLRVNAGELSRAGLDRWFQEAHEVVHGERARLPDEPACFLLAPGGSRLAFVGALVPSEDAVGRRFPLIAFTQVEVAPLVAHWPAVPVDFGPMLDAAVALLGEARGLTPAEVAARAQAIAPPAAAAGTSDGVAALAAEKLSPLGLSLGGLPHGAAYALRTLVTACDQTARRPTGGGAAAVAAITLDAPAPTDAARRMWLELVRRRLGWRDGMPSFLWTRGLEGRLLIALGAPANTLFAFLANQRHRSNRLWPLRTDVATALDDAVAALPEGQRQVLESPGQTLADVLAAFA